MRSLRALARGSATLFLWLAGCDVVDGQLRLGSQLLVAQRCEFEEIDGRAVVVFELDDDRRLRLVELDERRFLVLFVDEDDRAREEYGDCALGTIAFGRRRSERTIVDVDFSFDCRSRVPELVGRWRSRACDA